jgi:hypothetical protein
MIKNERQYQVAKQQAARLEAGLARLLSGRPERTIADPLLEETAHAGVQDILATLRSEIAEYESRMGKPDQDTDRRVAKRLNR